MKKGVKLLLWCILCVGMLCGGSMQVRAAASQVVIGGVTYKLISEKEGYQIIGCSKEAKTVALVDEIEGIPVTSIANYAFDGCENLSGNLVLPSGLKSIGKYAFSDCSGLSGSLIFPNGVTSIGECAFRYCSGLNGNLVLPSGITSIGECAFRYCSGLNGSLVLPSGITSIGECAFYECSGLSGSLVLPSGITNIGDSAFFGCSGLRGSLVLPSGITSIGDSAFFGCSGLRGSLVLPSGITSIGECAFFDCRGLSGSLVLPSGITNIGDSAFYGCSGLSGNLALPSGITSIGNSAFYGCSGLSGNLLLPNGVTSIGDVAFYGCSGLSGSVVLPTNLTSLGSAVFGRCKGIRRVTIRYGIKEIPNDTFGWCENLRSVNIPDSVTEIGEYAFKDCYMLQSMELPISVKSVGKGAFGACYNIERLIIPESVTTIGDDAIYSESYVCGYSGSTIQSYCTKNNIEFIALDKQVKVNFDVAGGKVNTSYIMVEPLCRYGVLPVAERYGYDFIGWYTTDEKKIDASTRVTTGREHTLYAKWEPSKCCIEYRGNGGYVGEGVKYITYGKPYGKLETPEKGGYKFVGWYTARKGGKKVTEKTIAEKLSITIYAHWKKGDLKKPNVKIKAKTKNSVTLSWKSVKGAKGYEVYRMDLSNMEYKLRKRITSGKKTSYVDKKLKPGQTYYYYVRAYKGSGANREYSADSRSVIAKIKKQSKKK